MSDYDIGDTVRLSATFKNSAGAASDPTTVTFLVGIQGSGSHESYLFGVDAEVVKDGVGSYHVDLVLATPGEHCWRAAGTGAVATAEEAHFSVRKSCFAI